jgi:zinc protease
VSVLGGNITLESARKLCSLDLAAWQHSKKPLPIVPTPAPIKGKHIFLLDKDTAQAQLNIGHIGINRVNPDRFALQVMNEILGGGGMTSRLGEEVRVKRGLTYGIYSFFASREFTGEFAVNTFTKVDSLSETITIILNELQRIREQPVTDQELKDAKQGLIGSFPLGFEQYEGIAQEYVQMNFYGLPKEDIIHYPAHINALTKADIQKAAQQYIHPDDIVITVTGPSAKLLPQLEKFGPVVTVPAI